MAASDGARLALDEAARDLARGVHPLLEVDREREEVEARAGLGPVGGAEHHGVAVADGDGAAGESGELAGLDGQRATTELGLECLDTGAVPPCRGGGDDLRAGRPTRPLGARCDRTPGCPGVRGGDASGGVRAVR